VSSRSLLPITGNILISAEHGQLRLTATNLEITTSCRVAAKVEEDGAITIPAKVLIGFVDTLPNERIDLVLRNKVLDFECARFKTSISGVDANEFPPLPTTGGDISTKIEAEQLRQGIKQVIFAVAKEGTRPVLTGVNVRLNNSGIALVAADSFRLAVYKASTDQSIEQPVDVIVPATALVELSRLLPDDMVDIAIGHNQIIFRAKDIQLISQLIQGKFPDYEHLIPKEHNTRVIAEKGELLRAIKASLFFAEDAIKMTVDNDGITVSSNNEEIGENTTDIDAIVEGDGIEIGFNGKFLTDVLNALNSPKVVIDMNGPLSTVRIGSMGMDNYIYCVQPMVLR